MNATAKGLLGLLTASNVEKRGYFGAYTHTVEVYLANSAASLVEVVEKG